MRLNPDVIATSARRVSAKLGSSNTSPIVPATAVELSNSVKEYIASARTHDDNSAFERAIGTNDLLSLYYFWSGLHASRSVGRIVIAASGSDPAAAATAFLIAPGLLMTNWHVFQNAEVAKRARIQFGYEADENGSERISTWFSLNPDRFFINDQHLDYCVVYVDESTQEGPDPLQTFGWLRLNPNLGKTAYGQYLSLIQHPEAQAKQVAIRENKLLPFDDTDDFLTYQSDTFKGSSGSPVFNDFWEVVALHHAGKPATDAAGNYLDRSGKPIVGRTPLEDEIQWVANEGARTSRIIAHIKTRASKGDLWALLESTFSGTLQAPVPWTVISGAQWEHPRLPIERSADVPAPSGTFIAYLPLNVSVRIESLDQPPLRALVTQAPTLLAPTPAADLGEPRFETLNFDDDYDDRDGYDETFLGRNNLAPLPAILSSAKNQIAPLKTKGTLLDYHHFSLLVHKVRRLPVLTACNVDYEDSERGGKGRASFGKDQWITDTRMDEKYQIPAGFYDRWKKLDYGHLVRREDNCWGASAKEIEYANSDTFHLTNCTPQHEAYNRSNKKGLWGLLENEIGKQSKSDKGIARLCVFAGPIFDEKKDLVCDDKAGKILVPLSFWKVVVAPLRKGGLGAYGFILSQANVLKDDPPFEDFVPSDAFVHQQVSLAVIEAKSIVRFDERIKQVDVFKNNAAGSESLTIQSIEDIRLV